MDQVVESPQTIQSDSSKPVDRHFSFDWKILVAVIVVAVVVLIGVGLLLPRQQEKTDVRRPVPEPENILLAKVGERQIFKNDVRNLALLYVESDVYNDQVEKKFLEVLIERTILDMEIAQGSIIVGEELLNSQLQKNLVTADSLFYKRDRDDIYYRLAKEAIEASLLSSIVLYRISYWIPSPDDPEADYPEYEDESQALKSSLQLIYDRVLRGEDPYVVTNEVYNSNSLIQKRIAYNGGVFKYINSSNDVRGPITLDVDKLSYPGDYFLQGALRISPGSTQLLTDPEGRGASVVKVVSRSSKNYDSYQSFFEAKKAELVTML